MMKAVSQSGSAILWVLIGVALVSAIGVSMMNSSRPSTETITDQAGKARAAQAQDYSNTVNAAVKRLKLRGCTDDEISYETPNGNSSNPNAPDDESCHVFRTAGGQVQYVGDDAAAPSKKVFFTSIAYTGNLGGIAGANAKCNERAAAANLSGVYKAWISDDSSSPATTFVRSVVPYTLIDGTVIADNWDDLVDGSLQNTPNMDELGNTAQPNIWTNTRADGTRYHTSTMRHCDNWTDENTYMGILGVPIDTSGGWTLDGSEDCNFTDARLYCFEQ
jgi:hypothetical protein